MVQIQVVSSVVEWRKRLDIEEERRNNHRFEPYVNNLAAPHPYRNGRKDDKESRTPVDFEKVVIDNINRFI